MPDVIIISFENIVNKFDSSLLSVCIYCQFLLFKKNNNNLIRLLPVEYLPR
jgi:hypothetical protein